LVNEHGQFASRENGVRVQEEDEFWGIIDQATQSDVHTSTKTQVRTRVDVGCTVSMRNAGDLHGARIVDNGYLGFPLESGEAILELVGLTVSHDDCMNRAHHHL
jgi:hypothetical protein